MRAPKLPWGPKYAWAFAAVNPMSATADIAAIEAPVMSEGRFMCRKG